MKVPAICRLTIAAWPLLRLAAANDRSSSVLTHSVAGLLTLTLTITLNKLRRTSGLCYIATVGIRQAWQVEMAYRCGSIHLFYLHSLFLYLRHIYFLITKACLLDSHFA